MSHQTQAEQGAPPYSQEQITHWLAFLARGMTEHTQTIFLMEKLQPSWLSARWQRWVYILVSRLFWGVLSGLVGGSVFGLIGGLINFLREGLIVGFLFGLGNGVLFGIVDIIRTTSKFNLSAQGGSPLLRRILWVMLFAGLVPGLTVGMFGMSDAGLMTGLINGLIGWVLFGVTGGVAWALRGEARTQRNEIRTVETVRFLPSAFPKGFKNGSIVGFIIGIIFGIVGLLVIKFVFQMIVQFENVLTTVLPMGLICGLLIGVLVGLLNCIQPAIREMKTIPNQGIWLSLRSASLIGGIGGLIVSIIVGLLGNWAVGLGYGALGGLCIGLWYGGLDVIQHFLVRFLLWRSASLPWRLAPFLDYAAEELHFLQKVGGGYIFVHRYLLEHFAAMGEDDGRPRTADGG